MQYQSIGMEIKADLWAKGTFCINDVKTAKIFKKIYTKACTKACSCMEAHI